MTAIISSPPTLIVDFSIDFLGSDDTALLTDASFGASIVAIDAGLEVTDLHHTVIPFQGAACWGAYDASLDAAFVIDTLHPNVTILDPGSGAVKGALQYDDSAMGGFDTAIYSNWMYVLAGDSSVVVLDLNSQVQVQHYGLGAYGPAGHWQGMAIYPTS